MKIIEGKAFPKAELHCHLEGCFRVSTIIELARERNVKLPYHDEKNIREKLLVSERCENLGKYLEPLQFTIRAFAGCTQAISRVTREMIEDKSKQGVRYLEIRLCPHLLANCDVAPMFNCDKKGNVTPSDVLNSVCDTAKHAGLEFNVNVGIIVCCLVDLPQWSAEIAQFCVDFMDKGVVGIDIAGDADYDGNLITKHAEAFTFCKERNIRRTVHAGEKGSSNEIHNAITHLHAERIGHGYKLVDDNKILNHAKLNNVHFEVCPISSYHTASVDPDLTKHPAIQFLKEGVNFSLSTDDPGLHQANLIMDYHLALNKFGFTIRDLKLLNMNALNAAFVDDTTREKLKLEFEQAYALICD